MIFSDSKELKALLKKMEASFEKNLGISDAINDSMARKELYNPFLPFWCIKLNPAEYLNNPYIKAVHPKPIKKGKISLSYKQYEPKEVFVFDEAKIGPSWIEENQVGYFEEPYSFLSIDEGDRNWMSLIPHEMNSMKKAIDEAAGVVSAYGLGLGYYPFMVSLKKEVREVRVIENDPNVISIFKDTILPFFPYPEKIKIIQGDAFDYAKKDDSDFIFFDIYRQPKEAIIPYCKMKHIEKERGLKVAYWIEDSIIATLRRALMVLILEEKENGEDDEPYRYSETLDDQIINALHFALKGHKILAGSDLNNLLLKENIVELAGKLKI